MEKYNFYLYIPCTLGPISVMLVIFIQINLTERIYITVSPFLVYMSIQLEYGEKLYISRQVCQALVFMHTTSPQIAHLDLKPANILVIIKTLL